MKSFIVSTLLVIALSACSPTEPPAEQLSQDSIPTPESVVQSFYDAVNTTDEETAFSLMTQKARESLQNDADGGGFSLDNAQYETVDIKPATVNGEEADVEVAAVQNGETQNMVMLLRLEDNAWRIFGVKVVLGPDQEFAMNFEKMGDMLNDMVETIGDGLQTSFQDAFENAQKAEQQLKHVQFETLHSISRQEFESMWMNKTDFKGQSYFDALNALANSLGLTVETDQIDSQLDDTVKIDVSNTSSLAAIDALCREAGVHPVYPEVDTQLGAWGGALVDSFAEGLAGLFDEDSSAIQFEGAQEIKETILTEINRRKGADEPVPYSLVIVPGSAPYPSAVAGPFRIGIREIEEKVPHGTGSLGLTIQGFGIHESVMALTSKVDEFIAIEHVDGSNGSSLIDPGISYHSNPSVGGNALTNYLNISLERLLRSVESIQLVDGSVKVYVPEQVDILEFEDVQPGSEQALGDLTVRFKDVGTNTNIEIEGPEARIEKLVANYELLDENKHVIPVVFDSGYPWGKKLQIQINSDIPPKSMIMKLVTQRQEIKFPFEINQVPLQHFAEMPEKIEALDFGDHEAPLTVTFVKFIEKGGDFNRVMVNVENHSNKDVTHAFIQFEYKDAQGNKLKDASTGISGAFNQDGQLPLAKAGESAEQETTAFFMPENTHSMDIKLNKADFIDGSEWDGMNP
jgi:hypothetical protein